MARPTPYPRRDDIRSAINARGWSIAEASRRIDRHPRYVRQVIGGRFPVSAALARALADVLGVEVAPTFDEVSV